MIGDITIKSRDEMRRVLANAPPISKEDLAFAVANADLVREDQAQALAEVSDATSFGARQKIMRYGIGAAVGLVLGVIACKVVG
jgi:hypothetical protein